MHNAGYKGLGLDFNYEKLNIEPRVLKPWIGQEALALKGFNVTVPHKVRMLKLVTQQDPLVEKVGAANTVINRDGVLHAYNTDVYGFIKALEVDLGVNPKGKNVLVIGSGGAARAVSVAVLEAGCSKLSITNRTLVYAKDMQEELVKYYQNEIEIYVLNSMNLLRAISEADIVVQTTSVGMAPDTDQTPMDNFITFHSGQKVMDLIYSPPQTLFMQKAKARGAQVSNGLSMLVYQGVAAFELMTGKTVDPQLFRTALEAERELPPDTWARQNRVPLQDQAGDPHANDPASFTGKH